MNRPVLILILVLGLCLFPPSLPWLHAQQAETLPLNASADLPYLLDVSAARQRVTFPDPVYARLWIDVTQGSASRTRHELILPQPSAVITFKALLQRRDFLPDRPPADNNRIRLEIETSPPEEPDSFTRWTNSDGAYFPPLPGARPGAVNVAVKLPAERPLETDCLVMTINEAIKDASGVTSDSRKIEVKVRFSKNPFQPTLK